MMAPVWKKKIVEQIQIHLAEELKTLVDPEGAFTEEAAPRVREIRDLVVMYKFLPLREYGDQDVVCPAGLVELDLNGTRAHYFLVPKGGGLVMKVDGRAIQVITPQSPLGDGLLGKRVGDQVSVPFANGTVRNYRIVSYQ